MCNVLGFATCGMGGAACFAGGEREIVVHPGFLSSEFDLQARLCRLATGQLSPSSLLAAPPPISSSRLPESQSRFR